MKMNMMMKIKNVVQSYKDLSKFKLSVFVVSTAAAGAVLGTTQPPDATTGTTTTEKKKNSLISSSSSSWLQQHYQQEQQKHQFVLLDEEKIKTILNASFGTALCAFSANSLNQILEKKQDGMMARTMDIYRWRCRGVLFNG